MSSLFSTPQQHPQSMFQSQPFQQTQQLQFQQPQNQPQHFFLFTNEKVPATYSTKWSDLHPDSQKFLFQIEERIHEYRDESQRLDQCSRLYDSSVSNDVFEIDSTHIVQELGGIGASMERQKTQMKVFMCVVKDMLRNTEVAVRSFMMLHPRFHHSNPGVSTSSTVSAPGKNTTSIVPVFDFYNGLPRKPSSFLQQTVSRFEKYLAECLQWVQELEQLLQSDLDRNSSNHTLSLLHSLPKVMSNVHDFFVHVAAKVESIHEYIESMKIEYLVDHRYRRDMNDPFLEADRRETAKQEAVSKRAHPTLHIPAIPQPTTQPSGLFASSASPTSSIFGQTSAAASSGSSGSVFSLFNTPTSASIASTPSFFSTPAPSAPPVSSLFQSSAASSQTSIFGPSTGSLFGPSTTPSLFTNTSSAFGSTTPVGTSLFSTPLAPGTAAPTGSGASFGTASKSARPKTRTSRR